MNLFLLQVHQCTLAAAVVTAIPVTHLLACTNNQRYRVKPRPLMQRLRILHTHQACRFQGTISMAMRNRMDTTDGTLPEMTIHHIHRQIQEIYMADTELGKDSKNLFSICVCCCGGGCFFVRGSFFINCRFKES